MGQRPDRVGLREGERRTVEIAIKVTSSMEFCCQRLQVGQVSEALAGGGSGVKRGYFQVGEEQHVCVLVERSVVKGNDDEGQSDNCRSDVLEQVRECGIQ